MRDDVDLFLEMSAERASNEARKQLKMLFPTIDLEF